MTGGLTSEFCQASWGFFNAQKAKIAVLLVDFDTFSAAFVRSIVGLSSANFNLW
jgi:hypothetical protein